MIALAIDDMTTFDELRCAHKLYPNEPLLRYAWARLDWTHKLAVPILRAWLLKNLGGWSHGRTCLRICVHNHDVHNILTRLLFIECIFTWSYPNTHTLASLDLFVIFIIWSLFCLSVEMCDRNKCMRYFEASTLFHTQSGQTRRAATPCLEDSNKKLGNVLQASTSSLRTGWSN
jgi:hypothetical protein